MLGSITIIMGIFNNTTFFALNRLMNPNKKFEVPLPFILENLNQTKRVLDGDNHEISIAAYGNQIPDSINLNYIIDEKMNTIKTRIKKTKSLQARTIF